MWNKYQTGEDKMSNEINRIGINPSSVNPYGNNPKGPETKPEDKQPEGAKTPPPGTQVNPNDVLTYMAQSAIVVNPKATTKTYDVSKYVTPEQAARIAGLMSDFEDKVVQGLLAIDETGELAGLSDSAKYEIAASMVK